MGGRGKNGLDEPHAPFSANVGGTTRLRPIGDSWPERPSTCGKDTRLFWILNERGHVGQQRCATHMHVIRLPRTLGRAGVQPGDLILWMNAGVYHIPWDTRFSFGLAPVVWFDTADHPMVARHHETPEQWWAAWT